MQLHVCWQLQKQQESTLGWYVARHIVSRLTLERWFCYRQFCLTAEEVEKRFAQGCAWIDHDRYGIILTQV